MVTVECQKTGCPNCGMEFNVLGAPDYVECGGCATHLQPYDERDDPPIPDVIVE